MGRHYFDKKNEVEDFRRVEVWWLKKYGYLKSRKYGGIEWAGGWSGEKSSIGLQSIFDENEPTSIRFFYTQTSHEGDKKNFDYLISFSKSRCYFGGFRYWFICPFSRNGIYCGRRVAVLYKGGNHFACRHCYNLSYSSRNVNRRGMLAREFDLLFRIENLEEKLGKKFYRGRPTRKFRRIIKLSDRIGGYESLGEFEDALNKRI